MTQPTDYCGNDITKIEGVKSQDECAQKCFQHGSCKGGPSVDPSIHPSICLYAHLRAAMSYDLRWGRHRCWIKRTKKNLRSVSAFPVAEVSFLHIKSRAYGRVCVVCRVLMNVYTGFMSNECKGGDYCGKPSSEGADRGRARTHTLNVSLSLSLCVCVCVCV